MGRTRGGLGEALVFVACMDAKAQHGHDTALSGSMARREREQGSQLEVRSAHLERVLGALGWHGPSGPGQGEERAGLSPRIGETENLKFEKVCYLHFLNSNHCTMEISNYQTAYKFACRGENGSDTMDNSYTIFVCLIYREHPDYKYRCKYINYELNMNAVADISQKIKTT